MKSFRLLKAILLMVLCVIGFISPLFGQITIDWVDIPHTVFTRLTKNIAYNVTVSLGSPGGPQGWAFSSQPMGSDSGTNVVVYVDQTPFHDSFPDANLCYASLDRGDTAFLYMQLDPGFISTLGIAGADTSGSVYQKYNPVDTNFLPDNYNNTRHYYTQWSFQMDTSTVMRYTKKGYETINAYGTVSVPYGSFPCLRYILFDTLISVLYYNNIPVYSDTNTRIGHQFVAENLSAVVCVFSQNDETNPYFTNAAVLERLTNYIPWGIEEAGVGKTIGRISCQPNPFTDRTDIQFGKGHRAEGIGLQIYDISGRVVRSFTLSSMPHALCWNGTDQTGHEVPSGVYFVRFNNGELSSTVKIIKTR